MVCVYTWTQVAHSGWGMTALGVCSLFLCVLGIEVSSPGLYSKSIYLLSSLAGPPCALLTDKRVETFNSCPLLQWNLLHVCFLRLS